MSERERENCQLFVCGYNLKKFHELPTLLRRQSIHNNKTPERENTSFIQIVPFGCGDCFFFGSKYYGDILNGALHSFSNVLNYVRHIEKLIHKKMRE